MIQGAVNFRKNRRNHLDKQKAHMIHTCLISVFSSSGRINVNDNRNKLLPIIKRKNVGLIHLFTFVLSN